MKIILVLCRKGKEEHQLGGLSDTSGERRCSGGAVLVALVRRGDILSVLKLHLLNG